MCGIVGYAKTTAAPGLDALFLQRACHAMRHRGPDGEGTWVDENAGLGHRRLSIIDLAGGAQPMGDASGRYWITFNGEIYNYKALREDLKSRGHAFRTHSDTEVILYSFIEWGADAPRRFRGIFAFGIWDRHERSLFLSRDHFGVKPLFYRPKSDSITFASELKPFIGLDGSSADVDRESVADFLALGYVLGPKTILKGVNKIAPGTSLLWRAGAVRHLPYWDLATAATEAASERPSDETLMEQYRTHLARAVESQMVSDVPVGAFLSGGLDSSSIVYHMGPHATRPLRTFSVGFTDPRFSEALGTEHHAEVIPDDLAQRLPALVRAFDEPLGDTSIVPTHFVAKLAAKHVKVVLSGDGADETLAGYDTYVADALQARYACVPASIHRLALRVARLIPPSGRKVGPDYKVRQFLAHAHSEPERAHFGWRTYFGADERRALLGTSTSAYDPFATYAAHYEPVAGANPLNRSLYVDIKTWLAEDILPKVDRASMAAGLESRVPFLDVDLVEFTMRLRPDQRMRGFRRKVILRRAMQARLPKVVLNRSKSGFNAPVSGWFRGSLRKLTEDLLDQASPLVDVGGSLTRTLWREHLSGAADHGFRLWCLASLLLWEREVARPGPMPGPAPDLRRPKGRQ
jgi:asparagine synthase (glutamine-hydrolysing)